MDTPLNAYGNPLRYFSVDNNLLTTEMFVETANPSGDSWPQYTLKSHSPSDIPSIHQLYVEHLDLSEYSFATKYFHNYTHWVLVKTSPFFQQFYSVMREELEARISSKALRAMVMQIESNTASQATMKYMADREYTAKVVTPSNTSPGRSSTPLKAVDDLQRITS